MVMLRLFLDEPEIIVAHFNHGTRKSADADEQFVREFCEQHKIKFITEKAELGAGVSEEKARAVRYSFLFRVAQEERGEVFTAHHVDDMIESVAINLVRGTGHRGLAPMSAVGVRRPLLERGWAKKDILRYAAENGVRFREDPTNSEDDYLRNRIRKDVRELDETTRTKVFELFLNQKTIEREIDEIVEAIVPEDNVFRREWFTNLDDEVALEILRFGLAKAGVATTRPQTLNFLKAIRTYQSGKKFNLPNDRLIKIGKKDFRI